MDAKTTGEDLGDTERSHNFRVSSNGLILYVK